MGLWKDISGILMSGECAPIIYGLRKLYRNKKNLSGQTNHTKKHTEYGQRAFLFEKIPTYFIYTKKKKKKKILLNEIFMKFLPLNSEFYVQFHILIFIYLLTCGLKKILN